MSSLNYKNLLIASRIIMVVIAVSVIGVLLSRDLVLSGEFSVQHDFLSPSPFFSDLVPKQRVEVTESFVRIVDQPVYTVLSFPRPFQNLSLDVVFSNPDNLMVEMGPQSGVPESYALQALNHPALNRMFEDSDLWTTAQSDDARAEKLYQKRSAQYIFKSLDQFYGNLPDQQFVGFYGVNWPVPYLPDFAASDTKTDVSVPLRGGHKFAVAIDSPDLDFSIKYQDANIDEGADPVNIKLFDWGGNIIDEWHYEDDGETRELGKTSGVVNADFSVEDLNHPAVYFIEIKASQDIVIQSLSTSAPYLVIVGRVSLAGGPDYIKEFGIDNLASVPMFTSAREWTAVTSHRSTLQDIHLASQSFSVSEPFKEFTFTFSRNKAFSLKKGYPMVVTEGNLVIQGRGIFALSEEQYFNPYPWLIDRTVELDGVDVSYVITDYEKPIVDEEGNQNQKINIDLSKVHAPNKELKLQLSLPDLESEHEFYMKSIQAGFSSEKVTLKNAWEKFKRFWEREIIKSG